MADKPKLTVIKALKDFRWECEAVLSEDRIATFEAMVKVKNLIVTPNIRQSLRNEILAAAMQWLAGKQMRWARDMWIDEGHLIPWPEDPLRWFPEEVRNHRKEKGK